MAVSTATVHAIAASLPIKAEPAPKKITIEHYFKIKTSMKRNCVGVQTMNLPNTVQNAR